MDDLIDIDALLEELQSWTTRRPSLGRVLTVARRIIKAIEQLRAKAEAFDALRFVGTIDEKAIFDLNGKQFAALPHDRLADVVSHGAE